MSTSVESIPRDTLGSRLKLSRRLEFEACLLCVIGAAAVILAVYRLNWFYERQSAYGFVESASAVGFTLHQLAMPATGISAWYGITAWAMTVSAIVCVLGGLATVGLSRVKRARLAGQIAVAACGVVILSLCLFLRSGPGLRRDIPGLSYPFGPAVWVGICGGGLVLLASALGVLAGLIARRTAPST